MYEIDRPATAGGVELNHEDFIALYKAQSIELQPRPASRGHALPPAHSAPAPASATTRRRLSPTSAEAAFRNIALDDNPTAPAGDQEFVRTIRAKAQGDLVVPSKQYETFKDFWLEKPFLNPARANTHITSGYDYHMKEIMRFWGNASNAFDENAPARAPAPQKNTRASGQPALKPTRRDPG